VATRQTVPRKRTFYDDYPDYTRPSLELSPEQRSRIFGRLKFLYGKQTAETWMPEFERILRVHHAHKPVEMIEKEKDYDPCERFSEEHIILITYGDNVKGVGPTSLSSLHHFVNTYTQGMINTLHILPFFPYSSDRGFAVVDFRRVDTKLGSWDDIREKKRRYDLMFDAVMNHCSSRSEMFQEFLNGNPFYKDFFIAYDSPDKLTEEQRRKIFRPRTSDILTRFETIHGLKFVWTTFSEDQIDLNFRNPAVLSQVVESILFYIRRGADMLRLDAVTYLWDEPGTESIHLKQTHEIIKLLRDVVDLVASGVALLTETNVPHRDNIFYFGDGYDEAHMVYNFALPPLVLHAFYRESSDTLSRWAQGLTKPSDQNVFLNILDTHDGIGLMGVKGLLPEDDIRFIVETAIKRGALISYKMAPDRTEEPYEINSTWWSAINPESDEESLDLQVRRYRASRSIALVLQGVPGIYIHGALGSTNDYRAFETSGIKRDVNRGVVDARDVEENLRDSSSKLSLLFRSGIGQIRARIQERAFHPRGSQLILMLSPKVFAVLRVSPESDQRILAVTGITEKTVEVQIPLKYLEVDQVQWRDLLSGREWTAEREILCLTIEPYGVVWLKPSGTASE